MQMKGRPCNTELLTLGDEKNRAEGVQGEESQH